MGDVSIEILDGGLGIAPATGDELHAVIGCTDGGVDNTILFTRDPKAMVASKGYGPAVEAAALTATKTGLPLLLCKVPSSVDGFVKGSDAAAVNIASSTDATPIVVTTSAAHGLADGAVIVIAGHLVNTSANGTHVAHVLSPTTFALVGIAGIGVGVATGTVQNTGVVVKGTGTSIPTITGTPNDTRRFRWRWVKGGTRGAAGATFQYSKDGGANWSPTLSIGASTTYTIPNTGIAISFAAGTWVAGDMWSWQTVEPHWDVDDIATMLGSLKATGYQFRMIELIGDMQASDASALSTALDDLRVNYRYTRLVGHVRDFDAAIDSDQSDYEDTLSNDVAGLAEARIAMTAGHYRVPSVIDNCQYRRPLLFALTPRIMANPIQVSPAKVRPSGGGALSGLNSPSQSEIDAKGLDDDLYIDTSQSPALQVARFITLRTRVGRPGWFVDNAGTMASPDSDYTFLPLCFVIDKASQITYQWLVDLLDDDVQLNPDTGKIDETEAQGEEARALNLFSTGMVTPRNCSSVTAALSRDDIILSTKTVNAHVRVVPKGYVKSIEVDIGFTNPALALQ